MRTFLENYFVFIKLTITLLLFSFLLLSCKDKTPVEVDNTTPVEVIEFSVSGRLNSFYPDEDLSNYIISINGPVIKKDTTDSKGEFVFKDVIEGKYALSLSDTLDVLGDTVVTINQDQLISLDLKDFWFNYLPLKIGNKWTYNFKYYPDQVDYGVYREGKLTWTIIKNGSDDKEFIIQEVAEGLKHYYDYFIDSSIVTNFGPDTLRATFNIVDDIWVKIKPSSFKLESGSILIKRYYPNYSWDHLKLRNYDLRYYLIFDQIKGSTNFHDITVKRSVGITSWKLNSSHNSGPHLNLGLREYSIQ